MEIPVPAKRRLVMLKKILDSYKERNITSQKIESIAGWSSAVVRRDIMCLGVKCGATNGYRVEELRNEIDKMFNAGKEELNCCIVGLGKMGQALMDTFELFDSHFKIVAGFDSSVNKTEVLSSSFPLHPTTLMNKIIREEKIQFALLTVDANEAQELCNALVNCGIKRIVNYSPCILTVPKDVKVENVGLLLALENLCVS